MRLTSNAGTFAETKQMQQKMRLSLEILSGPMDGLEFNFDKPEVTIGRADTNDLCLALDMLVSRNHAQIIVQDGAVLVEDIQSTNGTYLEGKRLTKKAILLSGDIFRIGLTELQIKF